MCSLDGGDMGRLERLGVCKCVALVKELDVGVWPKNDVYRSLT